MPRPKKEQPNHAGGLYEVKITIGKTIDGKLIRKSFYSSISKADAREQAEKWKIDKKVAEKSGDIFITDDPTLNEWVGVWLSTYKRGKIKDSTYNNNYDAPVRIHIKPFLGNYRLSEIRPMNVQEFLDIKAKTCGSGLLNKIRICLSELFEAAVENNLCARNPVTKNTKAKSSKKPKEKRFYTAEQRDLIVEFARNHRHGLSILILLETGISRSELLGLQWRDIGDDLVMHLRRSVTDVKNAVTGKWEVVVDGSMKNSFRRRDLPITRELYESIQKQPRSIKLGGSVRNKTPERIVETEFIIHNSVGGVQSPHNWYYYVYKPFMEDMRAYYLDKEIDVPILNPHEMRHTVATLWALDKVDLYAISKLGGWSDLKMLAKVYGHSDVEKMRETLYGKSQK